jgi:hypothetical protein
VVNIGSREPRRLSKLALRESALLAKVGYKSGEINTVNSVPFLSLTHMHFQRKVVVNGAADFTSVVETHKPLGDHDGCKIRRSIHNKVA